MEPYGRALPRTTMSQDAHINISGVKRVAVVGGGATGLVTLKTLLEEGAFETVRLFERRSDAGGVWLFDQDVAQQELDMYGRDSASEFPFRDQNGQLQYPSPAYDHMIGNIAHELISFHDFPYPGLPGSTGPVADGEKEESNLYPSRQVTLDYLHSYMEKYQLRQHISFSTEVISVRILGGSQWTITTRNVLTGSEDTEIWDAVVYAGGLWDRIYIPHIDGINLLPKENLVHARAYRSASMFAGKRLLVLGNGNSANDIAAHAVDVAQLPIYRSSRHKSYYSHVPDPERIHDVREVSSFSLGEDGKVAATLEGGRTITDIDVVIAATGYRYAVASLRLSSADNPDKDEDATTDDGRRMRGLYRHLFHARFPTLAFPGFAITWTPLSIYEAQAAVVARTFAGRLPLPSIEEMQLDEGRCIRQVGDHYRFHVIPLYPGGDPGYGNELREWALRAEEPERGTVGVFWDERRKWLLENNVRLKTLQMVRDRDSVPQ